MRTIHSLRELEPFGIVWLTGEADKHMYRILCDVTARGRRIVARALGLNEIKLDDPWNSGTAGNPHVGSLLVSPNLVTDLAIFALLESGCEQVYLVEPKMLSYLDPPGTIEKKPGRKRSMFGLRPGVVLGYHRDDTDDYRKEVLEDAHQNNLCLRVFRSPTTPAGYVSPSSAAYDDRNTHQMSGRVH